MADDEAPSKTLLLERREERALVSEGKSVLEERRDTLAQAIMSELRTVAPLQRKLHDIMTTARDALRQAALRHGPGGIRRLAASAAHHPSPGWRVTNYFGTRMVEASAAPARPAASQRWDSTPDAEWARVEHQRLLATVVEIAGHLNNLSRLVRTFRAVQRRVNALEHVVMPSLESSIRAIEFSLEEQERENMVRALTVKRRRGET